MRAEEVASFKKKVYGAGSEKKLLSADYCMDNITDLIQKHKDFKDIFIMQKWEEYNASRNGWIKSAKERNEIFERVYHGEQVLCNCGSSLHYLVKFGFVGCTNFKNENFKHDSYNFNDEIPEIKSFTDFKKEFEFPSTYLNHFKNHYNIPFVMSSILFEYLFEIYGQKPHANITHNVYNTGVKNALRSRNEEFLLAGLAKKKFDKVIEQPHFSMYLEGKYSVRIVDLLCTRNNTVYVLEQKKDESLCDFLKLELYRKIVETYLREKNDLRKVESYFVVYSNQATSPKCLTLDYFKNEF